MVAANWCTSILKQKISYHDADMLLQPKTLPPKILSTLKDFESEHQFRAIGNCFLKGFGDCGA